MIQFLKNVAIGGGLFALIGAGPGAFSLDARLAAGRENAAAPGHVAA
jgi:uncharacterized membrane protein YphA (DoxX/SURF4 family)